LTHLL